MIDKVICLVSDNAANMVKAGEILANALKSRNIHISF